jgi:hypothetical protein
MSDRPMNQQPPLDRLALATDAELEAALLDLAGALAASPAPNLAAVVRARVADLGVPAPSRRTWLDGLVRPAGRPLRRGLVLGLVALVLLAGIAAAIGFGLPGLRIVILGPEASPGPSSTAPVTAPPGSAASAGPSTRPTPTPALTPTPAPTAAAIETLGLGEPVDPAAVDAAAGYPVLLPTLPELGPPLGVFVRGAPPSAVASAAFRASSTIPAASLAPVAGGQPVAILVMEFPGTSDVDLLQKMLPPGTSIEPVTVDGHPGYWISGEPHELLYLDPNGNVQDEPARLASNVLAWNDGNRTLRIEGAPDLATAQRIAASMR